MYICRSELRLLISVHKAFLQIFHLKRDLLTIRKDTPRVLGLQALIASRGYIFFLELKQTDKVWNFRF